MFRGIDVKAVILGIGADLAATFVGMMAIMTFLGIGAGGEDLPEEEVRQLIERAFQEPRYLLLGGLLGLLGTMIGGYVAAKFADAAPLLNAACVGLFGVVLGIIFIGESPIWFSIIGILLTLPAAVAGGVLWRNRNHTRQTNRGNDRN
jgi:drug/metabolite transporter (DMT)-like permease